MNYWVYILQSLTTGKYYIGQSHNPELRLHYHNSEEKGFTARYRPWKLVYKHECNSRSNALVVERKIKQWKSKVMIEKLIRNEIQL